RLRNHRTAASQTSANASPCCSRGESRMDELFGPIVTPFLNFRIWNLKSRLVYSSFFFLRSALPNFEAAFFAPDFLAAVFSGASLTSFAAASGLAARFALGAAAAPPRFARLLALGVASDFPSVFAASFSSLETRIVT